MDEKSVLLLSRYRAGDSAAADEIFNRYINRLVGLARNRISKKLANRLDPEDIVQSVYRSFFERAKQGQFVTERSGDLWRLLATITVNKTRCHARYHGRQKRNVDREQALSSDAGDPMDSLATGPEEADVLAVLEELQAVMSTLTERRRTMLALRLQGQSVEEVALAVGRSQRTVLRFLEEAQTLFETRLRDAGSTPSP